MAKIFISYRREDSEYPAQSIYEKLTDYFGSESLVFDVDTIPLGIDFRDYLNQEVSKCDILLAVIGNKWLDILKQRLNEPNDFVRIEIQAALERDIPVVPVLVKNASVPSERDLPPELSQLAYKQAAEVRAGSDYQSHLKRLISGLDNLIADRPTAEDSTPEKKKKFDSVTKTFTNTLGMKFVLIPTGSFMMGSQLSYEEIIEKYGVKDYQIKYQHPKHKVKITHPFYLQTTTVTRGQWKQLMGDIPSADKDSSDDLPVVMVSWEDTQSFISKLNEKEGATHYRLPSEAEWEYACRAGSTADFSFGDDFKKLDEYAWFDFNYSEDATYPPVGSKKPNSWGLYDMHGNVWEWVEDEWHKNYNGAPDDGSPWIDNPRGKKRVARGGSIQFGAILCRSAYRDKRGLRFGDWDQGFRLAKSVTFDF